MTIGVFDSGVGGQAVARAIKQALPQATIMLREDKANLPYGNKTPQQLLQLVHPILQQMVAEGCEVIVVACNTVTTTIIKQLRSSLAIPLVGLEPMVKPAASMTKTGVIAVCATPATLASPRYQWLKQQYAPHTTVLEPDCSNWAIMIEHSQIERLQVAQRIDEVCQDGADVIVLGCTHYHWIETLISDVVAGRAMVIQPEQAVVAQLQRVLARLA